MKKFKLLQRQTEQQNLHAWRKSLLPNSDGEEKVIPLPFWLINGKFLEQRALQKLRAELERSVANAPLIEIRPSVVDLKTKTVQWDDLLIYDGSVGRAAINRWLKREAVADSFWRSLFWCDWSGLVSSEPITKWLGRRWGDGPTKK